MTWQPNKRTGWTKSRDEHSSRLSQVIRAVLEIVPGGVIRAGKETYSDLTAGFWLGIDGDGLAKLHVGNAAYYLRWTGAQLEVAHVITGAVRVDGGAIEWAGGKGRADDSGLQHIESAQRFWDVRPGSDRVMRVQAGDGYYGCAIEAFGANGYALFAESDTGYGVMGCAATGVGVTGVSDYIGVLASSLDTGLEAIAFETGTAIRARALNGATALAIVGGVVDGGLQRYTQLADATDDVDALNRRTADGRFLRKSAGWTGSFTADGQTVTVVDGQITGVS